MASAFPLPASHRPDASPRRRGLTFATVVAAHLLVLILLFRPGPPLPPKPVAPPDPKVFEVRQYADETVAPKPAPRGILAKARRTAGGGAVRAPTPPVPPVAP
ncbi:MAG TPA: hypothetical protein VF649_02105, partial [Sphingomonas sp.]